MPEPEQGIEPNDDAMSLNPGSRGVPGRIVLVCGALTAGAGALVLVGWALGSDALTAMGIGYIPMAPNTALLFTLLGSAVLVREIWPASRVIHRAAAVAALISAVVAGVTLIGFAIGLNIDDWLFRTTRMLGAVPIGRMSPITAFCFVLAGVSLLLLECKASTWAAILGILITLVGAVCLMGYWFGAPLLYGGTVIPVALPTSLALVALGTGLTAAADTDTWPLNTLIGPSTRARLLRALLPIIVLLALINDWITAMLLERSDPGVVLASAMTAISFLLAVSLVVMGISGAIGDAIDRTQAERKRAEETQARLAAIVEHSNDAIIGRTVDGMVTSWNAAAERILGYTAAEVIGRNPVELVPHELRQELTEWRNLIEAGQTVQNIETVRIAKDGRRIDVAIGFAATRDNSGGIIGTAAILRDITERKRATQELRESQQRLDGIITSAMDAIVTVDDERRIVLTNHAAEMMFGYTNAQLQGQPLDLLIPEHFRARYSADVAKFGESGVTKRGMGALGVISGLRKNGEEFPLEAAISKHESTGRRFFTAILRDITERKRSEQEIRDLNASLERRVAERTLQLEEASRAKSDFLANMSHELRTPLNSIIGFSEMLKDGVLGDLDAKQRGFVADIFDAGTHLLSLINDILDLSKVEAGMLQLEADRVDVAALLKSSTLVVREKAASHRIRLDTQLDPVVGTMLADERKLKQIVYNLLSNAVKFTPEGGAVTLRARRCARAEVALDAAMPGRLIALPPGADNEFLALTVEDTGVGIAEQDLPKLFEPFTQVDSSVARRDTGTGLGLSLVRRLAELHGGTVGVASRPGIGSRFYVWLPYRAAAPGAQGTWAMPLALVIEDEDRTAEQIAVQLSADGFETIRAATAEEGLVRAARLEPQLITLDLILSAMDGWEFLRRLKVIPKLADTPVVVITGISEGVDQGLALELGAWRVLHKPFAPKELAAVLAELRRALPKRAAD